MCVKLGIITIPGPAHSRLNIFLSRPNQVIRSDFVSHPAGFPKKCQPLTHIHKKKELHSQAQHKDISFQPGLRTVTPLPPISPLGPISPVGPRNPFCPGSPEIPGGPGGPGSPGRSPRGSHAHPPSGPGMKHKEYKHMGSYLGQ